MPELGGAGAFGTIEAGKDFRHGNFVLGVYGDLRFGDQTGTFST